MADYFGAKGAIGGVFKGTRLALSVGSSDKGKGTGDGGQKGFLVQNVNITYTRDITRVWELGSDDTYYVVGHTSGNATLSKIVGQAGNDFLDQFADVCAAKDKTLTLSGDTTTCTGTPKWGVTLSGPVVTQLGFAIDVGQFVITNQVALMFASLAKNSAT